MRSTADSNALPEGQAMCLFSASDPAADHLEGLKWRRRIYACMAYFALSASIVFLLYRGR